MHETFVSHLECAWTGEAAKAGVPHGLSPAGKPYWVRYDLPAVAKTLDRDTLDRRERDMWQFAELLPLADHAAHRVSLGETETPLIPLDGLASLIGTKPGQLVVKDEGRLPTGCFKARGIAMAVSMAREFGLKTLAMPTNGNAGAALAAYAKRAGMEAVILCPDDTVPTNVAEMSMAGARVYRVNGLIDDCGKIVGEACRRNGWFDVSTLKEPYRIEGKKTMGLELARQLGWTLPDVIFYPTGGGTGLIGMWKGFKELREIGFLEGKLPRMVAVQSTGCAPMVRAFEAGLRQATRWENAETWASGIRVPAAIGDFMILDTVRESGGFAIAVDDADSHSARRDALAYDGLLLCPEGAATLAAYRSALGSGLVQAGEQAVLFNCASGLKYDMEDSSLVLDRTGEIDFAAL